MIHVISQAITGSAGAAILADGTGNTQVTVNAVLNAPLGSVILSGGYDLNALSFGVPLTVLTNAPSLTTNSWVVNTAQVDTEIPWDEATIWSYVWGTIYMICKTA